MEFKQIQELIKSINKSTISELSIQDGDFQITIKQGAEPVAQEGGMQQQLPFHMMMPFAGMQAPQPLPQVQHAPAQAAPAAAQAAAPAADASGAGQQIKSPMIGTFYRSSSPDKPPFVSVGDEIRKGQVLCIVEAMKLFNEIESEVSGRIVKVLVDDASPVEYDQPLFIVEPA